MSDDEWDAAGSDDEPVAAAAAGADDVGPGAWADEDEDEDPIMGEDDWDVDPEEKKRQQAAKEAALAAKPKKLSAKAREAKQARMIEEAKRRAAAMSAAERAAEKAAEQKRVEDADHELAEELFMGAASGAGAGIPAKKATVRTTVADAVPALEEDADYQEFGEAVAAKVAEGDPMQVKLFLDAVLKGACDGMRLDDVNDVKKSVNVIYNQVRQSEVGKKKKGGKKKKFVNAGGAMDEYDPSTTAYVDDIDESDFM